MAERLTIDFKGLVTAPGRLSGAPGALTKANNVNFDAPGIASRRKGFEKPTFSIYGPCWSAIATKQSGMNLIFNTGGASGLVLQYGTGYSPPVTISTPDASPFTGTLEARMKGAVMGRNHYLTSDRAPARLHSSYSLEWAGGARAPGMNWTQQTIPQLAGAFVGAGAGPPGADGTWLLDAFAVAYRVVWVTYDGEGVEIPGAPSGRWVVSNTATTGGYAAGAARSTVLHVRVPYRVDTNSTAITGGQWKMRLYRSLAVDVNFLQPSDEMQLCHERNPTSAEIAAGYMVVEDFCPESALGAFLYTNSGTGGDVQTGAVKPGATGLGMAAANDRPPPYATDVAVYANCAFWSNFKTLQRLQFSIIATGAGALAAGNVLDLDGTIYTATAGTPANAQQFRAETTLGSVTVNIRQTAMNLVSSINASHPYISAAYVGSDASPGTIGAILLEHRRSDGLPFGFSVTTGPLTCYLPSMAPYGGLGSKQEILANGLCFSKPRQADAVPPANYVTVGRNDAGIRRLVALRDALFVFTDDGLYWVRGSSPADFSVEAFDTTFRLMAREACVVLDDAIYAWGREGIARITTGGVEFLDLPIRNFVQDCTRGLQASITLDTFSKNAFAVAYPVQKRVLFFFPNGTEVGGNGCTRALVYHERTGAWSTYQFDQPGDSTLNNRLSAAVRWTDEVLVAGEYAYGGGASKFYVERNANTNADFSEPADFAAGGGSVTSNVVGIPVELTWYAVTPNPAELAHWTEVQAYLTPAKLSSSVVAQDIAVTCFTEHSSVSITMSAVRDMVRAVLPYYVGMGSRFTVSLTSGTVDESFGLAGMGLIYHPVSGFAGRQP